MAGAASAFVLREVPDAAGTYEVCAILTIRASKLEVSPTACQLNVSIMFVSPAGIVTSLQKWTTDTAVLV